MIARLGPAYPTGYVISSSQVWRPGTYETERAARYAFQFDDETLERLQERANRERRNITTADLRAERKRVADILASVRVEDGVVYDRVHIHAEEYGGTVHEMWVPRT